MPYIQLLNENGLIAQLDMAQARSIANDIVVQCSRAEADAMLVKFFDKNEFPPEAGAALLVDFREFRHELDMAEIGRFDVPPPGGDE